jgi:electron transfer flavoprotein alpha subunit
MGELLVLIDHSEGQPKKLSLQMLAAANQVAGETGDTVAAVWLGEGASGAADVLGKHGAAKLYAWDSADAQGYVTLPQVEALEQVLETSGAEILFFASSNHVKDVAARLAVRTDGGVITDATGVAVVDGKIQATKEVFGGELITRCTFADGKKQYVGISNNAFPVEETGGGAPEVVQVDVTLSEAAKGSKVTSVEKQVSADRPDIAEAAVYARHGRLLPGWKSPELGGDARLSRRQLRHREVSWGGSPRRDFGPDGQESHRRHVGLGEPARGGEPVIAYGRGV